MPMAPVFQMLAAVAVPATFPPSLRMAPPPNKSNAGQDAVNYPCLGIGGIQHLNSCQHIEMQESERRGEMFLKMRPNLVPIRFRANIHLRGSLLFMKGMDGDSRPVVSLWCLAPLLRFEEGTGGRGSHRQRFPGPPCP